MKKRFFRPRDRQQTDWAASMEKFQEVFAAGCNDIVSLIQTEEFLRMDMTVYKERISKCLRAIRDICDRTISELER